MGDTNQMQPTIAGGGTHEVVLTSAPPYQTNIFGNFYMPTNTPLYGAGSDSAGALGLYHYTTRTNQFKEGEEPSGHNVNIGVHYVAATNSQPSTFNPQPLDADGDGIPDYVENWHGDGNYSLHTDTETDWQEAMTDGVTPDAYSTIYDNVDLDGDGLTGLAERIWGTNPLISDNPLYLTLPDGATVSGEVLIPLNIYISTNLDPTTSLELLVNGSLAEQAIIEQFADGSLWCDIDTTTMPNGTYLVQLQYTYSQLELQSIDLANRHVYGPVQIINVNNLITIDELTGTFGSALYIKADVNIPADTYTINIYNVANTNLIIKSLSGSVDNGRINTSWDLTDGKNKVLASGDLMAVFTFSTSLTQNSSKLMGSAMASANGAGGNSSTRITYRQELSSLADVNFVVSYGIGTPDPSGGPFYFSGQDYNNIEEAMIPDVVDPLCDPDDNSAYWLLPPGNSWDCCVFHLLTANNAKTLLSCVGSGNNFLFFGEAGDTTIGWNPGFLKASDVANVLGYGTNIVSRRPYRLVFLDGCDTYSPRWARAFGIPFSPNGSQCTVADYQAIGRDPRAFVGMDPRVGGVPAPTAGWPEWRWNLSFRKRPGETLGSSTALRAVFVSARTGSCSSNSSCARSSRSLLEPNTRRTSESIFCRSSVFSRRDSSRAACRETTSSRSVESSAGGGAVFMVANSDAFHGTKVKTF
jgi:hypothetical protein